MNNLKFVAFSDTHTYHKQIQLPLADVAIFAGDMCSVGYYKQEVKNFLDWYADQPHQYKIFIAGNHERCFDNEKRDEVIELIKEYPTLIYLNDTSVQIEGINIHGSPVTPRFGYDWAFNRLRGDDIQKHWDLIPTDTQILITHGPPYGYGDQTLRTYEKVGCKNLKEVIWNNPNIKVNIFGHIHEGYGVIQDGDKTFINAAVLDASYQVANDPIRFEYDSDTKKITIG